jgi:hypothetical protein
MVFMVLCSLYRLICKIFAKDSSQPREMQVAGLSFGKPSTPLGLIAGPFDPSTPLRT